MLRKQTVIKTAVKYYTHIYVPGGRPTGGWFIEQQINQMINHPPINQAVSGV